MKLTTVHMSSYIAFPKLQYISIGFELYSFDHALARFSLFSYAKVFAWDSGNTLGKVPIALITAVLVPLLFLDKRSA